MWLTTFFISASLSFFIAILGIKRRIGFFYSFLLGIKLSPIISICVILSSPSLLSYRAYEDYSYKNKNASIVFFVMGTLFLINGIYMYLQYVDIPAEYYHPNIWTAIIPGIGFVLLAYYLSHLPLHKKPDNFEILKKKELDNIFTSKLQNDKKRHHVNQSIKAKLRFNKKRILVGLIFIILILIITNPDQKRFKDYVGSENYRGLRREQNWLIYSVYSYHGNRFFAIFMNFFRY